MGDVKMKTKRAVIVQCRLSSTRLPQKAIRLLGTKPVLAWVLNSMHKVKADRYFVATDEESYKTLKPICDKYNFECFAGPLNDVLGRFCTLIRQIDCKTVIRATADNPFLFYEAAEESAQQFEKLNKEGHCDYFTYSGLPHGSGVEVFSAESLLKAEKETSDPYDHEHVGPSLYNHKDKYKCEFAKAPYRYNFPEIRTTIDTYSDFLHAVSVVNYLGEENAPYTTEQILKACAEKKVKYPVVLVPSVVKGHGTGHLHRCLHVAMENEYFIYIPEDKTLTEADDVINQYKEKGLKEYQIITQLPDENYLPIIITDTFELTKKQIFELNKGKALISIDDGSEFSDYCDYLLDIIPSFKTIRLANYTDSSFIVKPKNIHLETVKTFSKILVCLGGEDPAGFTLPTVKAIRSAYPDSKITAVISQKSDPYLEYAAGPNIEFTGPIPNLRENLYQYDLVFTHYGLTAFEAVYAGCGVILLPTTKLHKKLAQKYNFAYIKDSEITSNSVTQAAQSENVFPQLPVSKEYNSLAEYLKVVAGGNKMPCPICGNWPSKPDEIVSRNSTRTYRRCRTCGIVYMSYTTIGDKEYKKAYFFEDYKKQYGKTYQEDFESIKKQCLKRVSVIKSLKKLDSANVLDIGCAYGPFLSAAADSKLNPYGTDISEDAVSYVQNELHYPASVSSFPDIDVSSEFGIHKFDVVTMWYVIEHFKNLDAVLRKVSDIVKKDGIFAFSTPSGEGISAKSNVNHFYEISPTDHYTIWEPTKAKKILKNYGFEIVKIVSTGHHPERFPIVQEREYKPGSLQWKLIEKESHLKKLGDTVEIYCRKK